MNYNVGPIRTNLVAARRSMLLKEVALTAERPLRDAEAAIESMSRVVCSLVIKALGKSIQTPNFWKVSIRLNHSDRDDDGRILQGVLLKHAEVNVNQFACLSIDKKGMVILDLLMDRLREVFITNNLPVESLNKARAFVIDQGFRNTFAALPGVPSPDKQQVAYVTAEQLLNVANIELRIDTKGGQLVRSVPIAADSPDEFIFQRYFGKIVWIDNNRLTLSRVDGVDIPLSIKPD